MNTGIPAAMPPCRLAARTAMPLCRPAAFLLLLALAPSPARAQDDPRLRDALRLAQDGASDSARVVVNNLLKTIPPTDTLFPQVVYTMGLVSRSVEDMRRNYTRVSVEYANSAWADDALYRLGLLDYASGNVAGAVRQMDRIRSDYPDSPLIPTAAEWAARALFDQRKPREACDWLGTAMSRIGDDIELRNRLEFLNGRCANLSAADTAKPDTSKKDTTAAKPAPRTGFAVQIGAVNTQAAADKLAANLKGAGFTPYIVKDGALFKVRTGPWAERTKAQAVAAQVRGKIGGSPFVVKEP
ncbi:MAG TPA: SPOR domain-containing protein [Gemmatimonadales bacterium]|nr:SPOR domain-containing protein [Gemmatimonadales bacterium]